MRPIGREHDMAAAPPKPSGPRVVTVHAADDPPLVVKAVTPTDGVRDNPGSPSLLDPGTTGAAHDLPGQRLGRLA